MTESLTQFILNIEHDYAQVGAVRLHFVRSGAGERLVLLLHGFPECWYSWRHQLPVLAQGFTVVAPDLRGYNLSDKPLGIQHYEIDRLLDDLTGLIRRLGFERAAVVGHDWGAGLAWALALKYPQYVSKLAALQVPPLAAWRRNLTLSQLLASWYMFFFQLPWLPEWFVSRNKFALLDTTFRESAAHPEAFTDHDIDVFKRALAQPGALTAALNYYRANFRRGFLSARSDEFVTGPKKVTVPTLFIYGERDKAILPSTVRGVGAYVENSYHEVRIPHAGHWVQQEAPVEVNRALLAFLGS